MGLAIAKSFIELIVKLLAQLFYLIQKSIDLARINRLVTAAKFIPELENLLLFRIRLAAAATSCSTIATRKDQISITFFDVYFETNCESVGFSLSHLFVNPAWVYV
jgi:hypothetical protein